MSTATTLHWPKENRLVFHGRNGTGYQTGVVIYNWTEFGPGYLTLTPITSQGREANCTICLPDDPAILRQVASHLTLAALAIEERQGRVA